MRKATAIASTIKSVFAAFNKQADKVQEVLVEVAGHMVCHKEPSLGIKVLNEVKGTKHAEAIARWFAEYTVFAIRDGKPSINLARFDALTKGFPTDKDGQNADAAEAHMAALHDEPRWDYEPESEEKVKAVFDALEKVENLITTIAKKTKKGEGTHLDLERYLRSAIDQYKADRAVFESMRDEV